MIQKYCQPLLVTHSTWTPQLSLACNFHPDTTLCFQWGFFGSSSSKSGFCLPLHKGFTEKACICIIADALYLLSNHSSFFQVVPVNPLKKNECIFMKFSGIKKDYQLSVTLQTYTTAYSVLVLQGESFLRLTDARQQQLYITWKMT